VIVPYGRRGIWVFSQVVEEINRNESCALKEFMVQMSNFERFVN
jgi:hypothetical protein